MTLALCSSPVVQQCPRFEPFTPLQQLRGLNRSSPDFRDQLVDLLGEKEFQASIPNLERVDVMWVVNFLDTALCELDDAAVPRVFGTQRKVCGTHGLLPESYIIRSLPVSSCAFGGVNKAVRDSTNVAIKSLRIYATDDEATIKKRFCREVLALKRLMHPNILPLLGVGVEPLALVSEWMPNGNILEYTTMKPEVNRLALLLGVTEGLVYLHSRDIIHGDIKATNVLISNDGRANLSGFGLSTIIRDEKSAISSGGTLRWTAPEILEGTGSISKSSDIYAFGMLAWEVFAGAAPFVDSPPTTVAVQVLSGKRPNRPMHSSLTGEMWGLIQNCWAQIPLLRPKIQEVMYQLRRASIVPQRPEGASHFLVKEGATLVRILRKISEWPGGVPSSFRQLFSRFKISGFELSPTAPHSYDIKAHFSGSSISVDSWEK